MHVIAQSGQVVSLYTNKDQSNLSVLDAGRKKVVWTFSPYKNLNLEMRNSLFHAIVFHEDYQLM